MADPGADPNNQGIRAWLRRRAWIGPAWLAGMFIALLGGLVWMMDVQALESRRSDLLGNAGTAQESIRRRLDVNRHYLRLLAEDLARGTLDADLFQDRATSYVADHPELIGITFVDAGGTIRWAAPDVPDRPVAGLRLTLPEARRACDEARRSGEPVYTRSFVAIQGETVFEVYAPVFRDGTYVGAFAGTYACERLLRHALQRETFQKHRVSLVDEAGHIIVGLPIHARVDERLTTTVALDPPGHDLALRLARYGQGVWGWGNTLLAVLCVGLVLGMAWGMGSLKRQVVHRMEAEDALRRARDQLEDRVRERTADLETEMAERQHAEQRLRQQQEQLTNVARLSTMGEMAAGLAHELHQPLGAIASFAEGSLLMLEFGKGEPGEVRSAMKEVSNQAQRAGRIIHRLRDFVSQRGHDRTVADVAELTAEVSELMAIEARQQQVELSLEMPASLPPVLVDRIQVQQVLLNLVRNAIEAMQETEVGRRRVVVTATAGADPGGPGGEQVVLAVRDNGPGCPPERIGRIFDSFFTTKPRGMGMGLSISRSIIEGHHGRLWATSEPDGGFTVQFTLPAAEGRGDGTDGGDRGRDGEAEDSARSRGAGGTTRGTGEEADDGADVHARTSAGAGASTAAVEGRADAGRSPAGRSA